MKLVNRVNFLVALAFLVASSLYSQQKNEFSLMAKGPLSYLDYDLNPGAQIKGNGGGFGINYSYYLTKNWSMGLGAALQYYTSESSYNTVTDAYPTIDIEGESFEFRYNATNFIEQQEAYYINVPLQVQYETSGASTRFYIAGGAQVGFKASASYDGYFKTLSTSGFYSQYNVELFDPEFMGFKQLGRQNIVGGDLELKTAFSASLETGIKQIIGDKNSIYIAIFIDYGLNDISDASQDQNLIEYLTNEPSNFNYNSVFTSSNKQTGKAYIDEVKPMALGVKLRYGFSW